jgi:hypothetical protein
MGANQNTSHDESTLGEIAKAIKEDEAADAQKGYGLIVDLDAAARNRQNIENLRKNETPAWREGRTEPLLPRPEKKIATQEVKNVVGIAHVNSEAEIERLAIKIPKLPHGAKYDTLTLIPAVIEDLKTMSLEQCESKNHIAHNCLSGMLKKWKTKGLLPEGWEYNYKWKGGKKPNRKTKGRKSAQIKYNLNTLIPGVLEDLKTMSMGECEKKNGISNNYLSRMLQRWKINGLVAADYAPPSCKIGTHLQAREAHKTATSWFPHWNESWADGVKIAWLHAWEVANGK